MSTIIGLTGESLRESSKRVAANWLLAGLLARLEGRNPSLFLVWPAASGLLVPLAYGFLDASHYYDTRARERRPAPQATAGNADTPSNSVKSRGKTELISFEKSCVAPVKIRSASARPLQRQ